RTILVLQDVQISTPSERVWTIWRRRSPAAGEVGSALRTISREPSTVEGVLHGQYPAARADRRRHGLVRPRPFRPLHPLGDLLAAGAPGGGEDPRDDPGGAVPEVLRPLRSGPLRPARRAPPGARGGHEVLRRPPQAPRRFLPLRPGPARLQGHEPPPPP